MEVWLSPAVGFDSANRKATIYGTGENPISWISLMDVAQFAVRCLDNPTARNATWNWAALRRSVPWRWCQSSGKVGGKPFEVQHVPVQALQGQFAAATDPHAEVFRRNDDQRQHDPPD